jgi:hypothetical protein
VRSDEGRVSWADTQGYQQDGHDDVEQHDRVDEHVAHEEEGHAGISLANAGLIGLIAREQAASKIRPPVSGQHLEEDTCNEEEEDTCI